MDKFKNKYRIASNRKPGWNYSSNGSYFITLVTQKRECNLGIILEENGKPIIQLSDFGKIVEQEWIRSFEIRKELWLDEFRIMPNHLHAIVIIYGNNVETHGRASLQPPNQFNGSFMREPTSISSFIGGFKSAVNTKIDDYIDQHSLNIPKYNRNNHFFQSNYYDHIIRSEIEYLRIKNYIIKNPENWLNDKFYKG